MRQDNHLLQLEQGDLGHGLAFAHHAQPALVLADKAAVFFDQQIHRGAPFAGGVCRPPGGQGPLAAAVEAIVAHDRDRYGRFFP